MQRVESTVPYGAPCCTGIDSVPESDRWHQEGHSWGTPNRDVGYAVDLIQTETAGPGASPAARQEGADSVGSILRGRSRGPAPTEPADR